MESSKKFPGRGMYGGKNGFLSGFSWTILVSYICKKYPTNNEVELVYYFIKTFAEWDWSIPIFITSSHDYKINKKVSSIYMNNIIYNIFYLFFIYIFIY